MLCDKGVNRRSLRVEGKFFCLRGGEIVFVGAFKRAGRDQAAHGITDGAERPVA